MQHVFVLDHHKKPLMPCTPKRARLMMERGQAAVFKRYPFTIILKDRVGGAIQPLALKIDPGSKTTGLALVAEGQNGRRVIWGAELEHRGKQIKMDLLSRRALRSSRRSRKLRYRPARFLNRTKPEGWLPPSLMHRVLTTRTWAARLDKLTPMDSISLELVSFDTQRMENANIRGEQYQRGTLHGTEVRAYLMQKWNGKCAYCGSDAKLEVEHLVPKSRGGSNRVNNLVMACRKCNEVKATKTLEEFLSKKPAQLARITAEQRNPLCDAAAVNATKYRVRDELQKFGYILEQSSGAQTSFNRANQGFEKAHWIDAACVGSSGANVQIVPLKPLRIKSMGRGSRQMCGTDKNGFPIRHRTNRKVFFGFQTGDIVRANVATGKKAGVYMGRVSVRARGVFALPENDDVHHRFCTLVQRSDGYAYAR